MKHRHRPVGGLLLAMLAVGVTTSSCSTAPVGRQPASGVSGSGGPTASPAVAQATASVVPSCVARTLDALTEQQRIGQLFLMGLAGNALGVAERREINADNVGSVWFTAVTAEGSAAVRHVADAVQAQTSVTATGGVGFLVAANQEGGRVQALSGPGFTTIPSALLQGSMPPDALANAATSWASALAGAGVNLDFAPVADVVPAGFTTTNQPIGVLDREYGGDAASVSSHIAAFIVGMRAHGVATTLKHFPGLGRVTGNTDFTPATDPLTALPDASFQQGIAAGAGFVMVALARYPRIDPQQLAAFSQPVITGLLRGSLGFRGVVMSDDLGATAAVAGIPYGDRAIAFLDAGGDMVVSKTSAATAAMVTAVRARAATDSSFRSRLDASATRVLAAKELAGLLPC